MSGQSENRIIGMRGKRKGGLSARSTTDEPLPASLTACTASFLGHLAARAYSQGSIDAHRWALRQFIVWTEARPEHAPASFTRADLEAYQIFLHQYRSPRGGKPLVVNTQLARLGCVRRFFAWLCRSGKIPANPAADLDLPRKQSRQLPKALSEPEIQCLMSIPNTADPFGLRDRTILELFYATGIRRTEMTNLDHGDYDSRTQTLTVRKGKNGKSRMLPVGERAAAWLDRFLTESRPLFHHLPQETALFLSGYGERFSPAYLGNWIKKLLKRCGIDKPGSCHLWRHSCATDMHRGGADIRYVQEMLGHERMETTQIYTHVHIEALREVHTRCHPHGTLGPDRDMNGKLPWAVAVEVDFPSPPSGDPLSTSLSMSAIQCTSEGPSHLVAEERHLPPQAPPDDDPPAGNVPKPPPPPPQSPTGSKSDKRLEINDSEQNDLTTKRAGVAYYGYRFYDPVVGRWPSRDPIGESGGINIYSFVYNYPVGAIDYLGNFDIGIGNWNISISLNYSPPPSSTVTPFELGVEWLTGAGPRSRNFTDGDHFAELLRAHKHIRDKIQEATDETAKKCKGCDSSGYTITGANGKYDLSGVQGIGKYLGDYSTLLTGGNFGNLAVTFLGSYGADFVVDSVSCCKGTGKITITINNTSHAASALRPPYFGYTNWWQKYIAPQINKIFTATGTLQPTKQKIVIHEDISFQPNKNCKN